MTDIMKFHNDTDLPIIVSSWRTKMPGLSEYKDVTILANQIVDVYSDVGEWILSSQFFVKEYDDKWTKENLPHENRLAKFRNKCCAFGDFTWNFTEEYFVLEYKDNLVRWMRKSVESVDTSTSYNQYYI